MPPLSNNVFSWIGEVRPFKPEEPGSAPDPCAAAAQQQALTPREFNEVKALGAKMGSTETPDQDALANWIVVNPFGPVNETFRGAFDEPWPLDRRAGTAVRDDEPVIGRRVDQLLQQQGLLPVLAAADGHPGGGHGRQPQDGRRSRLDVAVPDAGLPRLAVRLQLLRRVHDERRQGVLPERRDGLRHQELRTPRGATPGSRATSLDAIEGRILTGFHFRSADELGAWIGEKTARWVDKHEFEPLDGSDHHHHHH